MDGLSGGKKNVIAALSGGVDSSVAALLKKRAGHNVMGVFMRLGHDSSRAEAAARAVAARLGIRFYGINLSYQFQEEVLRYFLDTYEAGETPNPCIRCNRQIKFGVMLRLLEDLNADLLVTGHYVRKETLVRDGRPVYKLKKGADQAKDQSYFLFTLTQERLRRIEFPVGGMEKQEVKRMAQKAKLPVLDKESQDVCFLMRNGKILDHNDFLKEKVKLKPGSIIEIMPADRSGRRAEREVGRHQGLPLYTIGQRRGVELGGTGPYYVASTDYKTNRLYVVADHDDDLLYADEFYMVDANWIGAEPAGEFRAEVAVRYRHQPISAKLRKLKDAVWKIRLEKPVRALTPGQGVAVYRGDELLGGGMIKMSIDLT